MGKRPSRASYFTIEERAERRAVVIDMHRRGLVPAMIAARHNITANYVRKLLHEAGEVVPEPRRNDIDPMWEMDEDARRQAIIRHAARAAKATRKAQFPRHSQFLTD